MIDIENFALKIPDLASKTSSELLHYFVYFLTIVQSHPSATASKISGCFSELRIPPYSNISAYLSTHSKRGSNRSFIKATSGYSLSRNAQVDIQKTLHSGPAKLETSLLLRNLLPEMEDLAEKTFLQEAIDCYEIGARRSAIVMVWILVIHHMSNFVLSSELAAFNAVLATNNDKRIRIKAIAKIDDFTEIPEGKFIEILRVAGIISNDVRKILDVKLGIRNSSAHPSAINISEVKATDFIIDLVENVIRKYRCP